MITNEADPILFLIEDDQSLVKEEITQDQGLIDGWRQQVHA